MKTILQQLYDGELCPSGQSRPKTKAYQLMEEKHHSNYKDFIEKLNTLNPLLVDQLISIMDEQSTELLCEFSDTFIDGFKLGAKMMIEILDKNYSCEKNV